ncbi:hypothetical protein GYH30_043217 [Glycine max]|nr:hypothetical protein GYH30_043217 [Glycine max]
MRRHSVVFRYCRAFYEGEDGGVGGGVRCRGADRDDVRLGVTSEVDRAKVVCGAANDLKEHGDSLLEGGGGRCGGQTRRGIGGGRDSEGCRQGYSGRSGCRR